MGAATQLKPPKVYGDPNVYKFIQDNIGAFINIAGDVFWVDLTNGKAGQDGSWQQPTNKIQTAHGFCTAGNGDAIFVKGFSHTADAVENLVWTKRDVSLIAAVPVGNARFLTVTPDSGIALDLQNGAHGCYFYGVRFVGAGNNPGAQIIAEGPKFEKCDFTSANRDGVLMLGTNAVPSASSAMPSAGAEFLDCMFRECGRDGIRLGNGTANDYYPTNVKIRDSQFYLNTGKDVGDDGTSGQGVHFSQWEIYLCRFMTRNKSVYLGLSLTNSTELVVNDCNFAVDSGRLTSTQVALPTGGVAMRLYDATGLVDTSGF